MSAYNDKRRDVKRAYRKKAFQSNMSQISSSAQATPLPEHSYSTQSHVQTTPVRAGLDPHTYRRDVRPAIESLDFARKLDYSRYPWNLVAKPDSANVIAREKIDFTTTNVTDNQYYDVLVLNIADTTGSETPGPAGVGTAAGDRGVVPTQDAVAAATATGAEAGAGNPDFPSKSGFATVGVSGTVRQAGPGEIYRIQSFGHSDISNSNISGSNPIDASNPIIYQIWVDGMLLMEWQNFQFAAVTPPVDQWQFLQPLTVTQQIVFRIINKTSDTLDTGEVEFCFVGWSEQLSGYEDVTHTQLEHGGI